MKILILIASGVEEIEALAPRDLFLRAGLEVDMMGIDNNTSIISSHKLGIDILPFDPNYIHKNYDALMIPGGKVGTTNIDNSPYIDEILSYFITNDKLVSAICAAPSILGKRGYLKDKEYTCYPGWEKEEYGIYLNAGVVSSGNFITGRSVYYSFPFAIKIIEHLLGHDLSEKIDNQIKGIR